MGDYQSMLPKGNIYRDSTWGSGNRQASVLKNLEAFRAGSASITTETGDNAFSNAVLILQRFTSVVNARLK